MSPRWLDDYWRLTRQAAWLAVNDRTQLEIRGGDRSAFLHNFCTADVRQLRPGSGAEAFITSVQGKTLGHLVIYCCPDSLLLDGDPQQNERLMAHLDRYILREDVQLLDRSGDWTQIWLGGAQVTERLNLDDGPWPDGAWQHRPAEVGGLPLWVRRLDMADVLLFALVVPNGDQASRLADHLQDRLGPPVAPEALDALQREYGFPRYGREITDGNLPQEIGRNAQAISFQKGCYLGQETVARIDALGHVNRRLVGLRFDGPDPPQPGTPLMHQGKVVGQVTSAGYSPKLEAPLALGYVRRECNAVGSRLESTAGAAEVVVLPLADSQGELR